MDAKIAVCDNCQRTYDIDELDGYHDFWSRVEVGKIIPAGDCPECGAFCYVDEGAGSSFQVKLDDEGIQLLDREGEIVYWHVEEWKEDPWIVFSIVNAILKGIYKSPAAVRTVIDHHEEAK